MRAMHTRIVILSPLVLLAAGCGGGNLTPPTPPVAACVPASPSEFAYVLNGDAVSMYTVNSCTGALTPTTPASVPTGTTPQEPGPESMVAAPGRKFVYVANLVSNASDQATISMYTVNASSGVLTPTTPATVPTGFLPQGITIHPSGNFVYTANSDDNTVSMFTVNPDTGVLTPTIPASAAAGRSPLSVTVDPSGRFAYVANQDDSTISMYNINSSTGVLTPMTPAIVGTGLYPFGVTVDPSGKFAYVPNAYSADNAVSQYTIDSLTGVLMPNTPSFVTAGNQPTDVAVDPTSKFAYVVNRADDTVTMYTIDPNSGNLTAKGTIATGSLPFRMVFDPAGKFAYVADENSGVSIYLLGTDGSLTFTGAPTPGGNALAVAVTGTKH